MPLWPSTGPKRCINSATPLRPAVRTARPQALASAAGSVISASAGSTPRRSAVRCRPCIGSAAGDRREEGQLVAVGQHGGLGGHLLVDRCAHRAGAGQGFGMQTAAGRQRLARLAHGRAVRQRQRAGLAQLLPQRREEAQLHGDRHASSSANGMKRTASPFTKAWPAGLSSRPSAQKAEVSTPLLWLPNSARPLASSSRTRRNSRRLSG
mmetsp:Transcript_36626/g.85050  ORF Transcript_36626/g.85050 Transcript_36626/m.85050 type:complete len:209 (-) Transcript_36626:477-1103(-)